MEKQQIITFFLNIVTNGQYNFYFFKPWIVSLKCMHTAVMLPCAFPERSIQK